MAGFFYALKSAEIELECQHVRKRTLLNFWFGN